MRKRILLSFLILAGFYTHAQTWQNVGAAPFSANNATALVMTMDTLGMPYVAFQDASQGNRATVMKYNGTTWELVGAAGFSPAAAEHISIDINNVSNRPYVTFKDPNNSNKLGIWGFNGSNWFAFGNPSAITTQAISRPQMRVDSGNDLYISFRDIGSGNGATVVHWNVGTSNWDYVGTQGFTGETSQYVKLAFDSNDSPVVSYANSIGQLKTYTFDGANWNQLGAAISSSGFLTPDLTMVGDTPYIVYVDGTDGDKAKVVTYDGTNWVEVSTAVSTGTIQYPSIESDDDGNLYVCYRDSDLGGATTVMMYDGTAWNVVGAAGVSGFVNYVSTSKTVAVDQFGSIYYAYESGGANVKKYECLVDIPDPNFKAALVADLSINTNADTEIQCSEAENYSGIIDVNANNISDLSGIEAFVNASGLDASSNTLTTVDISNNTQFDMVSFNFNQLTSIDVSNNLLLEILMLDFNNISSIDVTNLTNLDRLQIGINQLTDIDISNNLLLTTFGCSGNQLTWIDISNHPLITQFSAVDNDLTYLNVANGNNTNFTTFGSLQNPDLTCIEVDDPVYSTANWTNADPQHVFSDFCCTVDNGTSVSGVTITADMSGVTYQWVDCDNGFAAVAGETGQSFTASVDGNYACVIDDGNCEDTTACTTIAGVGFDEISHDLGLFPNPVEHILNINFNGSFSHLIIYNAVGEEVMRNTGTKVDVSELEAGIYVLMIQGAGEQHSARFVKQ